MGLVVVDVGVPADEVDLDAADADLGQAAGGEAGAAEGGVAVLAAQRQGLLGDVERLELFGGHQRPGAADRVHVERGGDPPRAAAAEGPLDDVEIAGAAVVARRCDERASRRGAA